VLHIELFFLAVALAVALAGIRALAAMAATQPYQ
jgi:hypothetical protein